jgi:hypothetical protein
VVDHVDRVMLVTEWRDLRSGVDLPEGYQDLAPLTETIEPWGWKVARARFAVLCQRLLPALKEWVSEPPPHRRDKVIELRGDKIQTEETGP